MIWKKAIKKPIPILFREVKPPFEKVNTREGITRAWAEKDYIIKGVCGELYPIKKKIFHETYEIIKEDNNE